MSALAWRLGGFLVENKTKAKDAVNPEVRGGEAEWSEEMTLGELLFYALMEGAERKD